MNFEKNVRIAAIAVLAAAVLVAALAPQAHAGRRAPEPIYPAGLGTVTTTTKLPPSCPEGFTCQVVTVACPEVRQTRPATIAIGAPTAPARGVVVLLTGGSGSTFWGSETAAAGAMLTDLQAAGLEVVQVRWHQSWLSAAGGESAGSIKLACRPATVIDWIHDTRYAPLGIEPATVGSCGFCVSGSSGGASATAYALSHFLLDEVIDGAFPTGGPPHAALAKGCMRVESEEDYWYAGASVKQIDSSYGFAKGGPCLANDHTFAPRWRQDSIDLTGNDYVHPTTRIHVLVGSLDRILPHAQDYRAKLEAAGTPTTVEVVPDMGHDISRYQQGIDRLYELLVA